MPLLPEYVSQPRAAESLRRGLAVLPPGSTKPASMFRSPRIRSLLLWLPLFLYSGLIFYLSSRPGPRRLPTALPHRDKVFHVLAYAVWGGLFAWAALRTWPGLRLGRVVVLAGLAGALYGLSDEIHQSLVPSRAADGLDLLADAAGAFLGAGCFVIYRKTSGPDTLDST